MNRKERRALLATSRKDIKKKAPSHQVELQEEITRLAEQFHASGLDWKTFKDRKAAEEKRDQRLAS